MIYFKGYKIIYDNPYHCYRIYYKKKYCCTKWKYIDCKDYVILQDGWYKYVRNKN